MSITIKEKRIRQFFRLSIGLKGLHALLEIVSGIVLCFVSPDQVMDLVVWITQTEITEDPHNFIISYLLRVAERLSINSIIFGAFYLLSHGIIKIALVIALLKDKLWAYPSSLAVFSLFIAYQVYRFSYTYSIALFLLTLFDLLVIWLIWREYKIMRKTHANKKNL